VQVFLAVAAHSLHLFIRVVGIAVEGNDYCLAEAAQVLHVLVEVPHALLHAIDVAFVDLVIAGTAVHLQGLERHHEHGEIRLQPRFTAFDIVEFLCS